jgi:F-type H+-transporting ATPase subunit b
MDINATLIAQALAFSILILFTVKFIWPPLMNAIEERQKKIADGLAAADNAKKEVADAKRKEEDIIRDARAKAQEILDRAHSTANQLMDQAKAESAAEKARQLAAAGVEVESLAQHAKSELRGKLAGLVVSGAGKLIKKEIDPNAHKQLIDQLITEI